MNPHPSKQTLFVDPKKGLLYSLYLALGSLSLFAFLNASYVTFQAVIWKYTESYIFNAAVITGTAFLCGILFFLTCLWMAKGIKHAPIIGMIGCILLIVYPVLVLINENLPSSNKFLILLILPALLTLAFSIVWWKRNNKI